MLESKLKSQISALNLDLRSKTVLTEAATGAYVVTPILAGLAGAEVYAFANSTKYGTTVEVFDYTRKAIQEMGLNLNIQFIDDLSPEIIAKADIITNSGHLRPLNNEKLESAKKGVVIPLMYEEWEWREGDLDIEYCRQKGIVVGATNERHPDVDVFNYLGDMAVKMIFDAGLTPYRNKFVLICNNDFGPFIAKTVVNICSGLGIIDIPENKSKYPDGITWLGNYPEIPRNEEFINSEAILFTAYPFDRSWIGDGKDIDVKRLKESFKNPFILRFAGDVDEQELIKSDIRIYPAKVKSGHMGILPSEIGFDPIIRLQAGGLKAGELMLKNLTDFKGIPLVSIM